MLAELTVAADRYLPSPWAITPPPATADRTEQLAPGVTVLHRVAAGPPPPTTAWDPPRWHTLALCRRTSWCAWFGDDDIRDRPTLRPTVLAAARALCAACPVQRRCLTHALTQPEHYGIWAGTSGRQRDAMHDRIERGESVAEVVDAWLAR